MGDQEKCESNEFLALLKAARAGSMASTDHLLERFRPYLLLIANQELKPDVQGKMGASDIVQESMLTALSAIKDFHGTCEEELRAWVRKIVINDLRDAERKYQTDRRNVGRELRLSSESRQIDVVDPNITPRSHAEVSEAMKTVRVAMEHLQDDYREVIRLRSWKQLTFPEIAETMGRSTEAVRKLWTRAIYQLSIELQHVTNSD